METLRPEGLSYKFVARVPVVIAACNPSKPRTVASSSLNANVIKATGKGVEESNKERHAMSKRILPQFDAGATFATHVIN